MIQCGSESQKYPSVVLDFNTCLNGKIILSHKKLDVIVGPFRVINTCPSVGLLVCCFVRGFPRGNPTVRATLALVSVYLANNSHVSNL